MLNKGSFHFTRKSGLSIWSKLYFLRIEKATIPINILYFVFSIVQLNKIPISLPPNILRETNSHI